MSDEYGHTLEQTKKFKDKEYFYTYNSFVKLVSLFDCVSDHQSKL